jgi:hypothetical protein
VSKLLKDVALDKDLAGAEGLDANNISRVRIHYLVAQHHAALQQVQFADAKAAAVMTLIGLLALRGPIDLSVIDAGPFPVAFAVMCATAVFCCIIAVFPRYPNKRISTKISRSEHWSWPALSKMEESSDDYADYMQTSEVSELVHSISLSNVILARVLRQKFMFLRLAFLSSGASVLLIFAYLGTRT